MIRRLSHIVSYITHPVFLPTILVGLYALNLYTTRYSVSVLQWLPPMLLVCITTLLMPLLLIIQMKNKGIVEDIMMHRRETRTMIYFIMFMTFSLLYFACSKLGYDILLSIFCAEGSVIMLAIMLINLRWKISIHCAGAGALVFNSALIFLSNTPAIMLAATCAAGFVSGLVIFARLDTDSHTPMQCLAGYTVGCALPVAVSGISYLFLQ